MSDEFDDLWEDLLLATFHGWRHLLPPNESKEQAAELRHRFTVPPGFDENNPPDGWIPPF